MSEYISVADLTEWKTEDLISYVRNRIPKEEHFFATREKLILLVARIMEESGTLLPDDVPIINTPGFDRIFILEDGNYSRAVNHLLIDLGLNSISELYRLLN